MISRAEFQEMSQQIAIEARAVLLEDGPLAAADYMAAGQRKLVGKLVETGQMTEERALAVLDAIDSMRAWFLKENGR